LLLGPAITVGSVVANGTNNGPVVLIQGAGNNDYIGVANLQAGVTSLTQLDRSTNTIGDTVGGVSTAAIPPAGGAAPGLDAPSATTTAKAVTATNVTTPLATVPTDGFASAVLQQLNITQGAAAGDMVALVQLPAGATGSKSLRVLGAPYIAGAASVTGTLTVLQQDIAGANSNFIFLGSYIPGPGPFGSPGSPPYPWTSPLATGSILATNEVITQGFASGDVLSVLFNTDTSVTTALNSVFFQGNSGDAFFQENTATLGSLFSYTGGSGGNYVQADSNNVIGTFDGGSNISFNILGQDNNNQGLFFVDFGSVILA
jgi:hypothetical protein